MHFLVYRGSIFLEYQFSSFTYKYSIILLSTSNVCQNNSNTISRPKVDVVREVPEISVVYV